MEHITLISPGIPEAEIVEGHYTKIQIQSQFAIIGTLLALPQRGTIVPTTRKHEKDREKPKKSAKIGHGEVRPKVGVGTGSPRRPADSGLTKIFQDSKGGKFYVTELDLQNQLASNFL